VCSTCTVLGQRENFRKVIFVVYRSLPLIQMISATPKKKTKIRKDSQKSSHKGRFFLREFCQSEKSKFEKLKVQLLKERRLLRTSHGFTLLTHVSELSNELP
jgi:hypothetical protein